MLGRGEISFGCDKTDMHVTLRNLIQQIRSGNRSQIQYRANSLDVSNKM